MEQQFAMKMNKDNLASLFEKMPNAVAIGKLAHQMLYVNARGETCYLLRTQGIHPYADGVGRKIVKGSDLRMRFNYDATRDEDLWFPIYPRT